MSSFTDGHRIQEAPGGPLARDAPRGAGAASRGTPVGARELAVEDAPAAQLQVSLEVLGVGTDFGFDFVGELSGKFDTKDAARAVRRGKHQTARHRSSRTTFSSRSREHKNFNIFKP